MLSSSPSLAKTIGIPYANPGPRSLVSRTQDPRPTVIGQELYRRGLGREEEEEEGEDEEHYQIHPQNRQGHP